MRCGTPGSWKLPPMTVAVLNAGGHLVAFAREDGSSLLRERNRQRQGARRAQHGRRQPRAGRAGRRPPAVHQRRDHTREGNLVPVPGGSLVRAPAADGEVGGIIGAVGVSGHQPDRDEECAVRGIEAAALTADPGA